MKQNPTKNQQEILAALGDLRGRLLDLTGNNPLLNYKHGRSTRYIRVVDELPGHVATSLLNGKSFRFGPVPKPTKEELKEWQEKTGKEGEPSSEDWARRYGIQTDYEVPQDTRQGAKGRHSDQFLQTLHLPNPLESRLASIARLARTSIEETGVNMLHLVVGFLEWYEDEESDKPRLAPLITVPVSLTKGQLQPSTRTYDYELEFSGEDCQENVSLGARLEQDFAYELPSLPDEIDAEAYLKEVARSIKTKFPRWKVRRFITLGFFNFGKLLMYRDLDPKTWPEDRKLEDNPLVSSVIAGTKQLENATQDGMHTAFEDECRIDEIDDIYESFPIIDDADSSQHSALIDAVKGKNLVIEGPPGTGKSQTITNLIAAAMYSGKTVLFVSEKLAALEVVKQRLDRLGLGLYCLELHSHATQKSGVIESLKQRIEAPARKPPAAYDDQIRRHRKLRNILANHADRLNSPWRETGMTIHQILVGAVRLREELPESLRDVLDPEAETSDWSNHFLEDLTQDSKAYQSLTANLVDELDGRPIHQHHPWRGIQASDLPIHHHKRAVGALEAWNEALASLRDHWNELEQFDSEVPEDNWEQVRGMPDEFKLLPNSDTNLSWTALPWAVQEGCARLKELNDGWNQLQDGLQSAGNKVDLEGLSKLDLSAAHNTLDALKGAGVAESAILGDLEAFVPKIEELLSLAEELSGYLTEYASACDLPPDLGFLKAEFSWTSLSRVAWLLYYVRIVRSEGLRFRNSAWMDPSVLQAIKNFVPRIRQLHAKRGELSELFAFESLPSEDALPILMGTLKEAGVFRRLFHSDYKKAKSDACSFLVNGKKSFDPRTIVALLGNLQSHLQQEAELHEHAKEVCQFPEGLWHGPDTDTDLLSNLTEFHQWIFNECNASTGGLFAADKLNAFGTWCLSCPEQDLERLLALERINFVEKANRIFSVTELLDQSSESGIILPKDAALLPEGDTPESYASILAGARGVSMIMTQPAWSAEESLKKAEENAVLFAKLRQDLEMWLTSVNELNKEAFQATLATDPSFAGDSADTLVATYVWAQAIQGLSDGSPIKKTLLQKPSPETFQFLSQWTSRLKSELTKAEKAGKAFASIAKADLSAWTMDCPTISSIAERNDQAIAHPEMLPAYLRFLTTRETLQNTGLSKLAATIESNACTPEMIGNACRHAVLLGLSNKILDQQPDLGKFDGDRHHQVQADFRKIDKELLNLTAGKVAAEVSRRCPPQGLRGVRVRDHSEMELLLHESNKQRSHLPIRQLLRRAGLATRALKPCFMMGPRSVAQYLDPTAITFDLLVIDEASQMKPADAIGAVARVQQVVVVGDPKQLPPTSFFDRLNSADEEEDEFALGTSESILDAMIPIFTARRLRWHYRSRHEALIAFSNRSFYDNNLLLFPSPGSSNGDLGVIFHRIDDGCFSDQVNPTEALAVAKRVEELLSKDPTLSLGVATMSAKQRDQIEGTIDRLAKDNPTFNRALAKNAELYEKIFVKNLESVQGDERAVMLISCTYGPSEIGGRVFQRFGPINSDVGWRRLNVLFTRSRNRMEIFSSMKSSDIIASETSSRGVIAFRQFLHYAETKNFEPGHTTGRPPDSDFEIAVSRLLAEHGFECEYQVGAAGFFIDLAVKHPKEPGRYIMGIECDGATYHSAKSARDRDRLRQEILESLGWNIRRIWSTDWFENPRGCIAPFIEELWSIASISPKK